MIEPATWPPEVVDALLDDHEDDAPTVDDLPEWCAGAFVGPRLTVDDLSWSMRIPSLRDY